MVLTAVLAAAIAVTGRRMLIGLGALLMLVTLVGASPHSVSNLVNGPTLEKHVFGAVELIAILAAVVVAATAWWRSGRTGGSPSQHRDGVTTMNSTLHTVKTREQSLILLIQAAIGLTWLRSGVEKVTDPHFVPTMGQTLSLFASHNPNGWYRGFLTSFAIPHAAAFGSIVEVGETLAGVALVASAVIAFVTAVPWCTAAAHSAALSAIVAGTLMSVNYWFAAAWLTPADDTVNLLMAVVQVLVGIAIALQVRGAPRAEWARGLGPSTSGTKATT